jgi:hypothetical protein
MNKTCIHFQPRFTACLLAVCGMIFTANAQYYYKDIVVTNQINANYRALKSNRVITVVLTPSALDPAQNTVTLQQTVYPAQQLVITYTKVPDAPESWLKSYYNAGGFLIKTTDSSADVVTTSLYQYDDGGRVSSISSNSVPVNDPAEKEVHTWHYNSNGQPIEMIKIKDNTDTSFISFTADEQGNPGEEKAIHKKNSLGTVYYYFDDRHRLTDVAKFNLKANRILPEYMFEYNDSMQVTQMIIVPEGSADYQTWKYLYNQRGLKEKDVCYNKQKQMVAGIEYTYTFGR